MSISEAWRRYAKMAKPKSYAEAAKPSTELGMHWISSRSG